MPTTIRRTPMRLIPLRPRAILPVLAVAALLLAACQNAGAGSTAPGGALDLAVSHTSAGDALSGAGGMTLYILTSDVGGKSTCTTGACASTWPALKGDGSQVHAGTGVSGTFGTTTWADGTKQVTHDGQPVYYYSGDSAAGDAKGQGANNVWFIAPVAAASAASQTQGTPNASATPYRAPGY
jgi:predicted lipoprotein with Yx(FWY)xxD motif